MTKLCCLDGDKIVCDEIQLKEIHMSEHFSFTEQEDCIPYVRNVIFIEPNHYDSFKFDVQMNDEEKSHTDSFQAHYEFFHFLVQFDKKMVVYDNDNDLVDEGYHTNYQYAPFKECDICMSDVDGFQLVFHFQYQIDNVSGGIGKHNDIVKHANGDCGFQMFNGSFFRLALVHTMTR